MRRSEPLWAPGDEVDTGAAQGRHACCGGAVQGTQAVLLVHALTGTGDQAHEASSVLFKSFRVTDSMARWQRFYVRRYGKPPSGRRQRASSPRQLLSAAAKAFSCSEISWTGMLSVSGDPRQINPRTSTNPRVGCCAKRGPSGETLREEVLRGHYKLNKIKILFNLGEDKTGLQPFGALCGPAGPFRAWSGPVPAPGPILPVSAYSI